MSHPLSAWRSAAASQVAVCEVSPRDGLQNDPAYLSTEEKVQLITRAVAAGAKRIEAVSFVNPKRVPAMADAAKVMAAVPREPAVRYSGLVMNGRGLDRAIECGVDEVNVVVISTDTFCLRNQNATTDQAIDTAGALVARARSAGLGATVTIGAAFGCPFEGEVSSGRLRSVISRVMAAEPSELALADTIGVAVPAEVTERLAAVREIAGDEQPLRAHFHDTRNTGVANALAALGTGVTSLDASIGGVGGCPFAPAATGNVATEDLVYAVHRSGVDTGLDLAGLVTTAGWLSGALGHDVPSALLRAGTFP